MTNCIVDNVKNFEKLSDVAKHIAQHDISGKHAANVFQQLVTDAENCGAMTKEDFFEYLRPFEEEILDIRAANGEKVKTNSGKYLYTKVSQNSTYRTNKAVIGKALDNSVALSDSGKMKGKTALEKEYKSKTTTITSDYEKCSVYASRIAAKWNALSTTERKAIKDTINSLGD